MSTKTTLALVNFSGQDITEVSVKNPSGFEDPYADLLPLLNGKPIRKNEALCGPVELLDGQPATFTLKLTFADGGTLELAPPDQPDQQDANTYKGGETYVNGVLGRDLGAEQSRARVWQLSGGGTNGMYVRTISPRGTASWMQRLVARKPDVTLGELVMPGSHDAGVYEITANYGPGGNEWAQTQNRSFQGQLDSGSRYFDIRVGWYNNVLHAYHGDTTGAWGGSLDTILDDVASFLRSSKEAVILKFSHNNDVSMCAQIVASVKTKLSGVIYESDAQTPRRLATIKLKELQGKALCVFGGDGDGFDTLWNPADGIFPYHDVPVSSPPPTPRLDVYDVYANKSSVDEMIEDQKGKLREHGGWGQEHLFLLSWTLTGGGDPTDLRVLTGMAYPWLPDTLARLGREGGRWPNIVYVDFVDPYVGGAIVAMNDLVGAEACMVNSDGEVWDLRDGYPSQQLPHASNDFARDVGVCPDGSIWVISGKSREPTGGGYAVKYLDPGSRRWVLLPSPTAAERIAGAPGGVAYAVNSVGELWQLTKRGKPMLLSPDGQDFARDVSIGADGSLWIVSGGTRGPLGSPLQYFDPNSEQWVPLPAPAAAERVAVGPDGQAYAVNRIGEVWRFPKQGTPVPLSPAGQDFARDIGVGSDGSVWIISTEQRSTNFAPKRLVDGPSPTWFTLPEPVAATEIAVR